MYSRFEIEKRRKEAQKANLDPEKFYREKRDGMKLKMFSTKLFRLYAHRHLKRGNLKKKLNLHELNTSTKKVEDTQKHIDRE